MATNYKKNGKESGYGSSGYGSRSKEAKDYGVSGYALKPREAKMDARSKGKKVSVEVKKKSTSPAPKSYGGRSSGMVGITSGLGYKKK